MECTPSSSAALGQERPVSQSSLSSDHLDDLYQYLNDPSEQNVDTICCQRLRCLESVRAIEIPRHEKVHFILKHVKVHPKGSSKSDNSPRKFTRKYYLPGRDGTPIVVCKEAFLKVAGVSSQLIDRTLKGVNRSTNDDNSLDESAYQASNLLPNQSSKLQTSSTSLSRSLSLDEIVQKALSHPVKLKEILQEKPELVECISSHFADCPEASPPNSPDTGLDTLRSQETSRQKRPLSSPESVTSLTKRATPKKSRDYTDVDSHISNDNQIPYPSLGSNFLFDSVFFTYYSNVDEQSAGEAAELLLDENLNVSSDASIQEESLQKQRPHSRPRRSRLALLAQNSPAQQQNTKQEDILIGRMKHLDLNAPDSKKAQHLNSSKTKRYIVPDFHSKARRNIRKTRSSRHRHKRSVRKQRSRVYPQIPDMTNLSIHDINPQNLRNNQSQSTEALTDTISSAFKKYKATSSSEKQNPIPEQSRIYNNQTRTNQFHSRSVYETNLNENIYKEYMLSNNSSLESSSDEGYQGNSDKVFVFGTRKKPSYLYPRYKNKTKFSFSQVANIQPLNQEKTINLSKNVHCSEIPDLSSLTIEQEPPVKFKNAPSPPPRLPRPVPSRPVPYQDRKSERPKHATQTRVVYNTDASHVSRCPPAEGATLVGKKLTISILQSEADAHQDHSYRSVSDVAGTNAQPRAHRINRPILQSYDESTSKREKQPILPSTVEPKTFKQENYNLRSPGTKSINKPILPGPHKSPSKQENHNFKNPSANINNGQFSPKRDKKRLENSVSEDEKGNVDDAYIARCTVPFHNSNNTLTSLQQHTETYSNQTCSSKQPVPESGTDVYQRPFEIRRAIRNYDSDITFNLEDSNLVKAKSLGNLAVAIPEEGDIVRGLECRVTVSHRIRHRPSMSSDSKSSNRKKGDGSCVIL